jgi:hypothetical protein
MSDAPAPSMSDGSHDSVWKKDVIPTAPLSGSPALPADPPEWYKCPECGQTNPPPHRPGCSKA